jgi:dTDP-3-amino-3,4,6-trideoxy-alpha-D-glucose transaminase
MQAATAQMATVARRNLPIAMTRLDDSDPALMQELLETVGRVARSAGFTLGPEVLAFEAEFAAYCGTGHAIGVSSGTDALALTLRALRIGPGDEVLVPANTFIGTAEAVSMAGAVPRFVDVDPHTGLVTADGIREALGPRTRGVIPVHLYGRTVDLEPIVELARDRGVAVVEDACQAHGAWVGSRRAGAIGDAGCFSFYPAKNLGAWGDAGAVVTDDPDLADRVRLIRAHGERGRYHHEVVGTTARMDAIQAAILRVKLRRLDGWNAARRRAGAALEAALHRASVTVVSPGLLADNVFHQFVVRSADRDGLRAHLAPRGIATAIHYPVPIHQTPAYATALRHPLPVSEDLAQRIISLPMHPGITDEEIARTAQAVHDFVP